MYWMMNPFHNHHSFIPVINAWAYDMIRIHGVKKALTHISVKLRERMQYLNGGVYIIHVWKKSKASYKDFTSRVLIFYHKNNSTRWSTLIVSQMFFHSKSTRKLILFSYEICTVLVITLFNFYKLNKSQKMSDLLHHIYPSKWANCSKNHQQQATKTYLLLVHYCSYGLYVNTSVCITLQVSSDIYLFLPSTKTFA